MSMEIAGYVGPRTAADGTLTTMRLTKDASQVVSDSHGRYTEAVGRNKVFTASNQAGTALTAFATSVTTGFMLYNPVGSGQRLSLLEIIFQQSTAAATAIDLISLAANVNPAAAVPASNTAITVRNAQLGSTATGVGIVYGATTKGTADIIVRALWAPSVSATATTGIPALIKDEVAGALEILPGCWVVMSATTAISGITTMTWEELPI